MKIKRNILLQITMLLLVVLLTVPVSAEILETLPQDVGEITGMPEETVDMEAEQIVETYPVYREVEAIPALDSLPMPEMGTALKVSPGTSRQTILTICMAVEPLPITDVVWHVLPWWQLT